MKTNSLIFVLAVVIIVSAFSRIPHAEVLPEAVITPEVVTFPDTAVGGTSTSETLTVTKSQSFLSLYIFGLRLGDTTDFTVTSDGCSGQTLNAGDTCLIEVAFKPGQQGHFETSIAIISLSREIIDYSTLQGNGIAPLVTLSTTSIDFGEQSVGKASAPYEVLLINNGTADLNITDISTSGEFSEIDNCGASVAAGSSCVVGAWFTPTTTGMKTGTVTIEDDASDAPQTIALQGEGVTPPVPDMSLSKHELDFGNQTVGTTGAPYAVIVTNSGTVDLSITSINIDGDYAQTNNCTPTLAPNTNCSVSMTFSPTTTGDRQGTLTVNGDAGDSPQTVALSGVGVNAGAPVVQLSSDTVDFGEETIDVPSNPQTLTLTNTGTSDLVGGESSITGSGNTNFSKIDRCREQTVPVGGTCTIDSIFTPIADGAVSATLTINNNASNSPQSVTLKGTGIGGGGTGGGCSLMRR